MCALLKHILLFVHNKLGMKKSFFKQGFTLIELLVVIAVIGILAAVILASLSNARDKGTVSAIKSNLKNMMAQAELHHSDNGSYATLCTTGGLIQPMTDALVAIVSSDKIRCYVPPALVDRDWAVAVTYNGVTYAVNPQGVVTFDTANLSGSKSYDGSTAACAALGKRLPSIAQLRAFHDVKDIATATRPWSSTELPNDPNRAYVVKLDTGVISDLSKTSTENTRCVS